MAVNYEIATNTKALLGEQAMTRTCVYRAVLARVGVCVLVRVGVRVTLLC